MKLVLSREEARSVDSGVLDRFGLPTLLLMENAGSAAANVIIDLRHEEASNHRLDRVVILGGTGQNGGDAWVVARHLVAQGIGVNVFLVGEAERVRGDARLMLDALLRVGVSVLDPLDDRALSAAIADATLIVDGMFGTGLDRPVDDRHAELFRRVNASPARVVSLDIPSGVDADTGQVLGAAVQADVTVTFGAIKRGLTQEPGASRAGALRVASLGIPIAGVGRCELIEERDVRALLLSSTLPAGAHKGTRGHVLVIAGSRGVEGAASLATRAAFRAGAGIVSLVTRGDPRDVLPEVMVRDRDALGSLLESAQSIVVGPGLGTDDYAVDILLEALRFRPSRGARSVVVDADALTLLAAREAIQKEVATLGAHVILTPHPGEAARLLDLPSSSAVQCDRFAAATQLAARFGATILLKGAGSLLCYRGVSSDPVFRVVGCSSPALAVAGSGDVLAGALGAFAVAHKGIDAATIASYLHAAIGAAEPIGLIASEVADAFPPHIQKLSR